MRASSSPMRLGLQLAVAAPVERPGAAERAVPGAAARELDRRGRIEHADEVLAPVGQQIARRRSARPGSRTFSGGGPSPARVTTPGQRVQARPRSSRAASSTRGVDVLALAPDDAVDGARGVLEDLARRERGAVPAHEEQNPRETLALGLLGQVDHLRDVGQVVHAERDGVGPPLVEQAQDSRRAASTCRSRMRTWCPARRAAAATSSTPSGSRRRKTSVYMSPLG